MLLVYEFTIPRFLLFTIFIICGDFITISVFVILSSLSFRFSKIDIIDDTINNLMVKFDVYLDGIFKEIAKGLLYTLVPVGFAVAVYMPVELLTKFNIYNLLVVILIIFSFIILKKGLKRYSSSILMSSRI